MFHTISFRSMNTDVGAWLWSTNRASARTALREVKCCFREAHTRFTRFETTSELSALNASSGQPFVASTDLFEVVALASKFSKVTKGLFNAAIIGALEAAGYDRTFEDVMHEKCDCVDSKDCITASRTRRPVEAPSVTLDVTQQTITLPPDTRLDLGGIVKGWTVQRAARRLSAYGPCLVDAGGDMMTYGTMAGQPGWRVAVADPFDSERDMALLCVRDLALATSGIDRRRWVRNGRMQHHLIDPRTGRPSDSDLISVTVVAPATVEAEVYAKAIFLLGSNKGLRFTEERPSLAALLVTREGDRVVSSRMERHVEF